MGKQAAAKSSKPSAAKKTAAKPTASAKGSPKPKAKAKSTSSRSTSVGTTNNESKRQQTLKFQSAEAANKPDEEMHALVMVNHVQPESIQVNQSSENTTSASSKIADSEHLPADDTHRRASAHFKELDAKTRRVRLKVLTTSLNNIEKKNRKTFRHDENDNDIFCKEEFRSICHDEHGTSDKFRYLFHMFF